MIAVVPAAGQSQRFGTSKLVADVGGTPMLERTIRSLLDGGVPRVVVVLAPDVTLESVSSLRDRRVRTAVNENPARGMFSSVQAGIAAARARDAIVLLPGDMPFVNGRTVSRVLAQAKKSSGAIVLPICAGKHGHPIVIPHTLRDAILSAPETSTLKEALAKTGAQYVEVDVDDRGVLRDVDTVKDLAGAEYQEL